MPTQIFIRLFSTYIETELLTYRKTNVGVLWLTYSHTRTSLYTSTVHEFHQVSIQNIRTHLINVSAVAECFIPLLVRHHGLALDIQHSNIDRHYGLALNSQHSNIQDLISVQWRVWVTAISEFLFFI